MGIIEGRKNIKEIYFHAKRYWQDLFPMLPSYTAFNVIFRPVCVA
jgi:hypothetical protein